MPLLSPTDQDRLRDTFVELVRPVKLLFFTQTLDCETCLQARQIVDELPPLSDKVTIEEVNLVLDKEKAQQFGIDRAPAIAVMTEQDGVERDTHIRFVGSPAGYEFVSLVQAVLLAGGRPSRLSDESRKRIEAVDKPTVMQVFTTPT